MYFSYIIYQYDNFAWQIDNLEVRNKAQTWPLKNTALIEWLVLFLIQKSGTLFFKSSISFIASTVVYEQ